MGCNVKDRNGSTCTLIFFFMCMSSVFADSASFRFENDCLVEHSDNDYSAGVGLEYWYRDEWKFLLQQNMYTPNDIRLPYHVPGERPYAGWLGMTVGKKLFDDPESPWTHYADIKFGMIGPSSQADNTQKWIHKIFGCKDPKGWHTQLSDEFCVNGEWWTKYNWYLCDYVAIVPRGGLIAGTIEDGAELGTDLKVGWNIKKHKDVGNTMMFSAPNPNVETFWEKVVAYAFIGGDCRYYLYNHFLEGSLFNNKDDAVTVEIEPFVGEFTFGAYLEAYGVFVMYYGTMRTDEYTTQKHHPNYGGLNIGYRWDF